MDRFWSKADGGAVNCGVAVQSKPVTEISVSHLRGAVHDCQLAHIHEALDAYRLLSSTGIGSFRIKPMFASGVALDNEDALSGSAEEIRELQEALIAMAAQPSSARLELPPPIFVDT